MKLAGAENCERQQIKNNSNTFVPDSNEFVGAVQNVELIGDISILYTIYNADSALFCPKGQIKRHKALL